MFLTNAGVNPSVMDRFARRLAIATRVNGVKIVLMVSTELVAPVEKLLMDMIVTDVQTGASQTGLIGHKSAPWTNVLVVKYVKHHAPLMSKHVTKNVEIHALKFEYHGTVLP